MTGYKYTEEELEDAFWRRWKQSMAFSGYHVSDEEIRKSRKEYKESGRAEKLEKLRKKARQEGRSLIDVMEEAKAKGEFF